MGILPLALQRRTAHLGPNFQALYTLTVLAYLTIVPLSFLLWLLFLAAPRLQWIPCALAGGQATVQLMVFSATWLNAQQEDCWMVRSCWTGALRDMDISMYRTTLDALASKKDDLMALHDVVFHSAALKIQAIVPDAIYAAFFLLSPASRQRMADGEGGQKHLNVTAIRGPTASMPPLLHIPLVNNTMVSDVLSQRRSLSSSASTQLSRHNSDLAFLARVAGVSSVVCVPAYVGMTLVGALQLGFKTAPHNMEHVRADAESVAQILAATISCLEPTLPASNPITCDSQEDAEAWAGRYQMRISTNAQPPFLFSSRNAQNEAAPTNAPSRRGTGFGDRSRTASFSSLDRCSHVNRELRGMLASDSRTPSQSGVPSTSSFASSFTSPAPIDTEFTDDAHDTSAREGDEDESNDDDSLLRACELGVGIGQTGAYIEGQPLEPLLESQSHDYTEELPSPHLLPSSDEAPTQDLKLFECIGKGGFAKVYRGMWGDMEVAVKFITFDIDEATPDNGLQDEAKALLEAAVSWTMHHPNVVRTYTYMHSFGPLKANPTERGIAIVMEYCDCGTLIKALDKQLLIRTIQTKSGACVRKVDMPVILATLDEIASALEHLHMLKIVHRDLKLRNVLMKSAPDDFRGWSIRLADFGLSMMLADNLHVSREAAGTVQYMAPELLAHGQVTWQTDVYALGIIMWELFHSTRVFSGMKKPQIMYMVIQQAFRPSFSSTCPESYKRLACRCWHQDWQQRPTCTEIRKELEAIGTELRTLPPRPPAAH